MCDILMLEKMVEIFNTIMVTATVRATIISSNTSSGDLAADAVAARAGLRRVKSVQQTVGAVLRSSIMFGGFSMLHSFTL